MSRHRRKRSYRARLRVKKLFRTPFGRSIMRELHRSHTAFRGYVEELIQGMYLSTCAPEDLDRIAGLMEIKR